MYSLGSDSQLSIAEPHGRLPLLAGLIILSLLAMPWVNLPYGGLDWVAFSQVYGPPYPSEVEIVSEPPEPTTADNIRITLSGTWPNACIPEYKEHRIDGSDILIVGEGGPEPGSVCAQVITSWSFSVNIGQLEAGTYTVRVRIVSSDGFITIEQTTQLEVTEATLLPAGMDNLTAHVFVDHRCNGSFDDDDIPLPDVLVTVSTPGGARASQRTTSFGMVYFASFDASEGVTVGIELPGSYRRRSLGMCPAGQTRIQLEPSDFQPGRIGHKHVQFRAYTSGTSGGYP